MENFLDFSGYKWIVKYSDEKMNPGPNYFTRSGDCLWVDDAGLHLSLKKSGDAVFSTEVSSVESFGYGTYQFTVRADTGSFSPAAVLGLFLYDENVPVHHNEMDIEYSSWKILDNVIFQYVMQPSEVPGHMVRFYPEKSDIVTHSFTWTTDRIVFKTWNGRIGDASDENLVNCWVYRGNIPVPADEKVHLNLWLYGGDSTGHNDLEVVIEKFVFIPAITGEKYKSFK